MSTTWRALITDFQLTCSPFQHLHIHMILLTIEMVTAVQIQRLCAVLKDGQKFNSSIGFETRKQSQNMVRIMIFKIANFLIGLGNLMICTHDLIVLTKTKEMIRYCGSHAFSGKMLSTIVCIILMQVSVPVENGSQ
jgi:hypothetical protein